MIQDGKLTDEEAAARLDALLGGLGGEAKPQDGPGPEASRWTDEEAAARLDALIPKKPGLLDAFAGQMLEGGANLAGQARIASEKLAGVLGTSPETPFFGGIESGLRGAAESVYPAAQRGQGGVAEDVVGTLGGMVPTVASGIVGGPLIGAAAFGAQEGVPLYYEIKAKTGDEEAATWGLLAGNAIGQFERFGAEKALSGIVKKIAGKSGLVKGLADKATGYMLGIGGATEAGTEIAQTGLSDLVYETLSKDDIDNWENIKRSIPPSLILGEGFHVLDAAIQEGRAKAHGATEAPLPDTPGPEQIAAMAVPMEGSGDLGPQSAATPPSEGITLPQPTSAPASPVGAETAQAEAVAPPEVVSQQGVAATTAQPKEAPVYIQEPLASEAVLAPEVVESGPDGPKAAQPSTPPQIAQETGTPPVEPQPAQAPAVAPEEQPEPTTGIKNRTVEAELEKMGLEPPNGPERKTFVGLHAKAMERMKADPHAGAKLVDELTAKRRTPSGEEAALLSLENNRLIVEREAAEEAFLANQTAETKARVEAAKEAYGKAADAFKLAGSEAGISLAARKMMIARDYSLAAMERSLQVAKNGKPLTEQESKKVSELHRRMVAAEKALSDHEAGAAAKVAGLEAKIAALEAKVEAAPKTPRNARKRASIIESKKRIGEILDQLGGQQKAAAGLDLEKVKLVGELAYHSVKLGYNSFTVWADDVVARVGESIRPYLKAAWDEAKAKSDEEMLKRYKSRKKGDIKRLQERGEAGLFDAFGRTTPVGSDKEAVKLKAEYEQARRTFERLKEKKRREGRTGREKAMDAVKETLDLPRAVMSSFDFSAVRRQGGILTLAHPVRTLRHMRKMFRAFASPDAALEADVALRDPTLNKHYELSQAAGLELTSSDDLGPQEEGIRSRLSDRMPGVKASNRAYVTFMNLQRAEAFGAIVESLPKEPTLDEAKAIAEAINVLTGRASGRGKKLAAKLEGIKLFWAPSYAISRFQVLGMPLTVLADKRLSSAAKRKLGKELARYALGQSAYYALFIAAAEGIEDLTDEEFSVGTDPRSSDFGKIKIGDVRIDPLSGISQVARLVARLATGETVTQGGKVKELGGEGPYDQSRADVIEDFLRSKLGPVQSRIYDALKGKNFVGEKVTPTEALTQPPIPLAARDTYEALRELGVPEGIILGVLSVFGDSIQTYNNEKTK